MTGLDYLEGNWKVYRDMAKKINMIEPVLEGIMQLFFQSIILYIVYGPGTSNVQSIFQIIHFVNLRNNIFRDQLYSYANLT